MKVKELLKYIEDKKLYFEIIDSDFISYGYYKKDELKQSKFINDKIININVQYTNDKRLFVIKIDR